MYLEFSIVNSFTSLGHIISYICKNYENYLHYKIKKKNPKTTYGGNFQKRIFIFSKIKHILDGFGRIFMLDWHNNVVQTKKKRKKRLTMSNNNLQSSFALHQIKRTFHKFVRRRHVATIHFRRSFSFPFSALYLFI